MVFDGCERVNSPGYFADDLPHKRSPLAEMALHARDSWFHLAGCDFLHHQILISNYPSFKIPPSNIISQEAVLRLTWPAFMPTAMPDFCLTSFGIVAMLVEEVVGAESS